MARRPTCTISPFQGEMVGPLLRWPRVGQRRCRAMQTVLPIGGMVFPGTGIQGRVFAGLLTLH